MIDAAYLQQWIGRSERRVDLINGAPVMAMEALLDLEPVALQSGNPLPPLWHWLYFLPIIRQSEIGIDGHPQRGGFLPPIPLPRRMWAGGRLQFIKPLYVGESLERISRIVNVKVKEGRSGKLAFVTLLHEYVSSAGVVIKEEQDIVYREHGSGTVAGSRPFREALWEQDIVPDPVMLFRYSALTFNGHRIHYDRAYATAEENYPGLVVHGPLIATLLLQLVHLNRPDSLVCSYNFKAVRPIFDSEMFKVCGAPSEDGNSILLWATDKDGFIAMEASAELAPK